MSEMINAMSTMPPAAVGWSLLYMLLGGGVVGAIVIYFVARLAGR